jgi:hypothetical protein
MEQMLTSSEWQNARALSRGALKKPYPCYNCAKKIWIDAADGNPVACYPALWE